VIFVGIDDTDMPGTRGTNHLARHLAAVIAPRYRCEHIVRHQLCADSRIPCTSKNGSASLAIVPVHDHDPRWLIDVLRDAMRREFIPGSDPGLCVAESVSDEIRDFGLLAKREMTNQVVAREIAEAAGIHLEGLAGTEDGVIGALAAVGLAATLDDGRVIQLADWPDDLQGIVPVDDVTSRGITVRYANQAEPVSSGQLDLVKKLRPCLRQGHMVLTVEPSSGSADWVALREV
jgi:tRNA(Ile2) C34 agmatinyltransferase TiaS